MLIGEVFKNMAFMMNDGNDESIINNQHVTGVSRF